jgi:hypothetical protein
MTLVAILALPAMLAAAPAPERAPSLAAKPVCQENRVSEAERGKAPVRAHPLTAEPPAKQILTVLRTVDGCTRPVVIREDVGAPAR